MIEARGLRKRYGSAVAVDGLTFDIRPGVVTGFLGPNGAGKSTTLRMILGLDRPTEGTVTVAGRAYRDLAAPMHEVGALLDAKAVHGKRSARQHLRWLAQAGGLPATRVDEVLAEVGLARSPAAASAASRSACRSGWASPRRCSATRGRCSSTSPSTASTRRASAGSGRSCAGSPTRAAPSSSPATS